MAEPGPVSIGEISVTLRRVMTPIGLEVDTVVLGGSDVTIQPSPFAISGPTPISAEVTITAAAIQALLAEKAPGGLSGIQVVIDDGQIIVTGTKRILVDIPATAKCRLRIFEGSQIFVDLVSVEVLRGASLTNVIRSQIDALNPLIDAADLPIALTFSEIVSDEGTIRVRGSVPPDWQKPLVS
jgi:hypothetical protein